MNATLTDRRYLAALGRSCSRMIVALERFAESTSPILGDMTARIQSISQILARVRPLEGHIVSELAKRAGEKLPEAMSQTIAKFVTAIGSQRESSALFEAFDTLFDRIAVLPPAERHAMVQRLVWVAGSLRGLSKGDPARGLTRTMGRSALAVGESLLSLLRYFAPGQVARK
ncbi:MAG: hypothetical protein C0467_31510 [Planctomycetaceae bacterium]|nr:hypothetical protein [Planctomycetaceae bacterium]